MAELGIAASITGVITIACQVCNIISDFVDNVADAPNSAHKALATVHHTNLLLGSVRDVVEALSRQPRDDTMSRHIQYLKVILRGALQSFAELFATVRSVGKHKATGIKWDRLKWVRQEKNVISILEQLESQKTSINVMLNVLQSQQLVECIERLGAGSRSAANAGDADNQLSRPPSDAPATDMPSLATPPAELKSCDETAPMTDCFTRPFELTLKETPLYQRVRSSATSASFKSSNTRSHAWSVLSEISIDKISNVSVVAMPIDYERRKPYRTRRTALDNIRAPSKIQRPISRPASFLALDDWTGVSSETSVRYSKAQRRSSRHGTAFSSNLYSCPWCLDSNFGPSDLKTHMTDYCGSRNGWICHACNHFSHRIRDQRKHCSKSEECKRHGCKRYRLKYDRKAFACPWCGTVSTTLVEYVEHIVRSDYCYDLHSISDSERSLQIRSLLLRFDLHDTVARLCAKRLGGSGDIDDFSWIQYDTERLSKVVQQLEYGEVDIEPNEPNLGISSRNFTAWLERLIDDGILEYNQAYIDSRFLEMTRLDADVDLAVENIPNDSID